MSEAPAEADTRGDLEFGSIPGLAALSAARFGEALFIVDGDVSLSFREVAALAERTARALMASGVRRGDRVALWAPNIWEWVVAALGVHGAGGVLVPLNTRFKGEEAAFVLSRSGARVLLTVERFLGTEYLSMLRRAGASAPQLETTVLLRGEAAGSALGWGEFLERGAAVSAAQVRDRAGSVGSDDVCDLMFTSGTTGHPKGVMSTHGQTLRAFRQWAEIVGLRSGDRYLVVAPFFHSFGYKAGWLASLMMGATVLPQAVFDANAVLERLGPDRINVLPGPPALYQSLLARPDLERFDLSALRLAVTGAAVIPVELIVRMRQELKLETIITAYGLTEATGVSTMCRRNDSPETIATTSGRAIPGVEVRVVDTSGRALEPGEPGEVVVRGYSVMQGYFEDAAQTSEVIDAEGWLHTGDIGVMDTRGYLRITDRKKDMFIVGGFNAYPAEIEAVLLQHPAVAQVAVGGMPDPRLGEVGLAYVVARSGSEVDPGALIAWSREKMANYKVPRRVEVVDALPMNATGKVLKHVLRDRAAALTAPGN